METPIQKAINYCDNLLTGLEVESRTNYEDAYPKIETVTNILVTLKGLITDEKEMINQIYSNCEKIKTQ
jgi:hypothetical protein